MIASVAARTGQPSIVIRWWFTGDEPFEFDIVAFVGRHDRRITRDMVARWQRFTRGAFSLRYIDGHHLFPLDREGKRQWLDAIVVAIQRGLTPS